MKPTYLVVVLFFAYVSFDVESSKRTSEDEHALTTPIVPTLRF